MGVWVGGWVAGCVLEGGGYVIECGRCCDVRVICVFAAGFAAFSLRNHKKKFKKNILNELCFCLVIAAWYLPT